MSFSDTGGCLLILNFISPSWSFYCTNDFLRPTGRNVLNSTHACQHCCMRILATIKQAFGGGGGTRNLWYKLELWIALWLCAPSVKLGCLNGEKARNSHKSQIAVQLGSLITGKVWFRVNKKCTVSMPKYWRAFKSIKKKKKSVRGWKGHSRWGEPAQGESLMKHYAASFLVLRIAPRLRDSESVFCRSISSRQASHVNPVI